MKICLYDEDYWNGWKCDRWMYESTVLMNPQYMLYLM
jgi:hypothetical protein